jgi:hypothetical protein
MVAMMDQRFEELTANMQFQLRDGMDNRSKQLQLTYKEETQQLLRLGNGPMNAMDGIEWDDLIDLDTVKGWEKEYTDAVYLAQSQNGWEKLTNYMELGIKAATQRLKSGDLYPPEPVRSLEFGFFALAMERRMSAVGDFNAGLFSLVKERNFTIMMYAETLDTQNILAIEWRSTHAI